MGKMTGRLVLLSRGALLCLLCLLSSCGTRAPENALQPPFTLVQVGPNVWAAISNPQSKAAAWANTGFVIGDDAVAIIDTTQSTDGDGNFDTEPAELLLVAIRKLTSLPVRFVINTHYHVDHVGANAVFVKAGAVVLAHHNVHTWIHSENLRMFGKDIRPEQKLYINTLLPPAFTYDHTVDLYLGSRQISVRSFPGHTGGDSVVTIPDANVVFTGDLFWRNMLPNMMDASTGPWIDTLDTLVTYEPSTTFVPGHGDVGTGHDVAAFRDYLVTLRKLVSEARASAKSAESVADTVMPVLSGKYSRWDSFQLARRVVKVRMLMRRGHRETGAGCGMRLRPLMSASVSIMLGLARSSDPEL